MPMGEFSPELHALSCHETGRHEGCEPERPYIGRNARAQLVTAEHSQRDERQHRGKPAILLYQNGFGTAQADGRRRKAYVLFSVRGLNSRI